LYSCLISGRLFLNATSGTHFYFHQKTLASNSFLKVDKKIESVTQLEFNAYVVDSTPHHCRLNPVQILCKAKVSDMSCSKCYRKLQRGFISFTCAWCNDDNAVGVVR
ncbi:unnamed protein product, partial [Brassica oleracea var. botrytis]